MIEEMFISSSSSATDWSRQRSWEQQRDTKKLAQRSQQLICHKSHRWIVDEKIYEFKPWVLNIRKGFNCNLSESLELWLSPRASQSYKAGPRGSKKWAPPAGRPATEAMQLGPHAGRFGRPQNISGCLDIFAEHSMGQVGSSQLYRFNRILVKSVATSPMITNQPPVALLVVITYNHPISTPTIHA